MTDDSASYEKSQPIIQGEKKEKLNGFSYPFFFLYLKISGGKKIFQR
jgi:hypothetical protein